MGEDRVRTLGWVKQNATLFTVCFKMRSNAAHSVSFQKVKLRATEWNCLGILIDTSFARIRNTVVTF